MRRNYTREWSNICNALAESVMEMSDEEVAAEAAESGEDLKAEAERVREILRQAVKAHREKQ